MRQQSPVNQEHFVDYSTLSRQYSPRPQNYDVMWRTEYQFGTSVCDHSVPGLSSQYYQAVSYRYCDSWHDACVNQYVPIGTDYVSKRPGDCQIYADQRRHATSRLRVTNRSRSYSRPRRYDNSSRCRRRHQRSRSSRGVSRSSEGAGHIGSRRRLGRHFECEHTSQRRSRHTRHHQRRRYSSSSSSSQGSRSPTVSHFHTLLYCTVCVTKRICSQGSRSPTVSLF